MTYEEQIKYLTENPDKIIDQWTDGTGIFKRIGINNRSGCLTQIKSAAGKNLRQVIKDKDGSKIVDTVFFGVYIKGIFYDYDLTEKIQKDNRIPNHPDKITPAMLPAFKEWQEKIDKLESQK